MSLGLSERAEIPFFLPEPLWFWSLLLHPLCLDLNGIHLRYSIISTLWTCSFPRKSIGCVCDRWEKKAACIQCELVLSWNIQNVQLMNCIRREERPGPCLRGKSPAHTEGCRGQHLLRCFLHSACTSGEGAVLLLYEKQSHFPYPLRVIEAKT